MEHRKIRKLLSVLLCLVMLCGLLPLNALAAENGLPEEIPEEQETIREIPEETVRESAEDAPEIEEELPEDSEEGPAEISDAVPEEKPEEILLQEDEVKENLAAQPPIVTYNGIQTAAAVAVGSFTQTEQEISGTAYLVTLPEGAVFTSVSGLSDAIGMSGYCSNGSNALEAPTAEEDFFCDGDFSAASLLVKTGFSFAVTGVSTSGVKGFVIWGLDPTMENFLTLIVQIAVPAAPAPVGQVKVIVRNDTYSKNEGAAWDGVLVNEWVDIYSDSTMMSAVVTALDNHEYTQTGAEDNYISDINGLAEFDGGDMSGWMGTLNDWFTSEGFDAFTVKDKTLSAGDEICLMYTCERGEDCGGSWYNNDKTLSKLVFSAGTLSPAFSETVTEYTLTVPAGTTAVTVTPTAVNKNFQVRTFVGDAMYKRTASVPVADGTVITVKVGDPSWPTMNGAEDVPAVTYTVTVAEAGTPETPVTVPIKAYVNFSSAGAVLNDKNGKAIINAPVELDTKASYTIDDILAAAHDLYYNGGAEAGYATGDQGSGLSLTKFWGSENSSMFGYQLNGGTVGVWALDQAVSDGDHLDVTIYQSAYPDTETYTAFNAYAASGVDNAPLELTLKGMEYDVNWNPVMTPLAGATITVDGTAVDVVTGADGEASLSLTVGTHVISAVMTKEVGGGTVTAITPPVCVLSVVPGAVKTSVNFTSQLNGAFLHAPQTNVEVSSDLAEKYGYTDAVSASESVSALDVLVKAHEIVFGDAFTKETADNYLAVGAYGSPTLQFAVPSSEYYGGFFVNDVLPQDDKGVGTVVNTQPVASGDLVSFFFYEDEYYGDTYTWFTGKEGYARSFSATVNEPLKLTLNGFFAMEWYQFSSMAELLNSDSVLDVADAQICLVNTATGALTPVEGAVTDEDGLVELTFAEPGTYTVAARGTEDSMFALILSTTTVNVERPQIPAERRLSNLALSAGTASTAVQYAFTPAFDPAVSEYTVLVPDGVSALYARATLDTGASGAITVSYTSTSNAAKTVTLNSGNTTATSLAQCLKADTAGKDLQVLVNGELAYTLHVLRYPQLTALSIMDADSKVLTLTPAFNKSVFNYTANALSGLDLTVTASCKSYASYTVNGSAETTVTPVWADHASEILVKVTAEGAEPACYTVTLTETPVSLSVSKAPAKTVYDIGDVFDPTGIELTATYADDSEKIITEGFTVEPAGKLSTETFVTISYGGAEVQQPIEMSASLSGTGTAEDPFIIASTADITLVGALSAAGKTFAGETLKLTADVTLPADWVPMGENKAEFAGTIDGDGHTLTVPAGGKALIGRALDATVKDLKLYGTQIDDYGLVSVYTTGYTNTTCITIDNVTILSGTKILKSGFIGGYASGSFKIVIRNCTAQEGVVIGYDKTQSNIGTFAGEFNGSIENCVSSATVYGVNYVGGIIGDKGQTMGAGCVMDSCTFHGTVTATGNHVGGITGSGYGGTQWGVSSAPNTPCVTIRNCTVDGKVTGVDYVGGIQGSELACAQCWDNGIGYLQNNTFTGTVSGTGTYVGAIVGFQRSLNKYTVISGNTYAPGCGAARPFGGVEFVDTSYASPTPVEGVTYFSTENGKSGCPTISGCSWRTQHNRTDDPLGADIESLARCLHAYISTRNDDGTVTYTCACGSSYTVSGLPFTVTAGSETLGDVTKTAGGYAYKTDDGETVMDLYTVVVPQGTSEVTVSFPDNVLAYNYSGAWGRDNSTAIPTSADLSDGGNYYSDYLAGAVINFNEGNAVAVVKIDSDSDGRMDYLDVQSPYDNDASANWGYGNSFAMYAITFFEQTAEMIAEDVNTAVETLPESSVENYQIIKETLEKARAEYDALDDESKALVDVNALEAAESMLTVLEETVAVNDAVEAIAAQEELSAADYAQLQYLSDRMDLIEASCGDIEISPVREKIAAQLERIPVSMDLVGGKTVTLTLLNPATGKNYAAKALQWVLAEEDKPAASLTAAGKLTTQKVAAVRYITATATVKATGEESVMRIRLLPMASDIRLYTDGTDVTDDSLAILPGSVVKMEAMVLPADAQKDVTWKSSNSKTARVDAEGNVTCVKAGTVTITATAKDGSKKSASVKLIIGVPVNSITVSNLPVSLAAKKSVTLKAAVNADATVKKVTWSLKYASDSAYLTVTSAGKLTVKNVDRLHTVTIVAAAADAAGYSQEFTLKVHPASSTVRIFCGKEVTNTTMSLDLRSSASIKLTPVVYPIAYGTAVTWKSSNAKIAAVDAKGAVTFLKAGTVTITATASDGSGVKASVKLTAVNGMKDLVIIGSNTVKPGKSIVLKASCAADTTNKAVYWSVAEGNEWASVTTSGKLTAKKGISEEKTVTVQALAMDGTGETAFFTVTIKP